MVRESSAGVSSREVWISSARETMPCNAMRRRLFLADWEMAGRDKLSFVPRGSCVLLLHTSVYLLPHFLPLAKNC